MLMPAVSHPTLILPQVTQSGEGRFTVSYTLETAAEHEVHIRIGEEHIGGSPFRLQVAPGEVEPSRCLTVGWVESTLTAGHSAKMWLLCRDKYGNLRASG